MKLVQCSSTFFFENMADKINFDLKVQAMLAMGASVADQKAAQREAATPPPGKHMPPADDEPATPAPVAQPANPAAAKANVPSAPNTGAADAAPAKKGPGRPPGSGKKQQEAAAASKDGTGAAAAKPKSETHMIDLDNGQKVAVQVTPVQGGFSASAGGFSDAIPAQVAATADEAVKLVKSELAKAAKAAADTKTADTGEVDDLDDLGDEEGGDDGEEGGLPVPEDFGGSTALRQNAITHMTLLRDSGYTREQTIEALTKDGNAVQKAYWPGVAANNGKCASANALQKVIDETPIKFEA